MTRAPDGPEDPRPPLRPLRIVALDGAAVNPGDLSWAPVERLGSLAVHPNSTPDEARERARGADALLVNKVGVDDALLAAAPSVRYVGVQATGHNVVDLDAARRRGVAVSNVPGYSTRSVAQHAFALLLELANRTARHAALFADGSWARAPIFTLYDPGLVELDGKTLGIVGYGAIGRAVAGIGRAMGMVPVAHTRDTTRARADGVECLDLDPLLRRADVASLHCPLTPDTRGMIDARRLALMRPTAFLLNTARGPLVDESALAAALRAGRLAGAGLDVLADEPPPPDHPLMDCPNAVVTPHMAWATRAARARLLDEVAENLRAWRDGRPRNRVD